MRLLSILSFIVILAIHPSIAEACAVCATTDATLDDPARARPFEGRLRAAVDARIGGVEAGGARVDDRRFELALSYAVDPDDLLTLAAPLLARTISLTDGTAPAVERTSAGDAEVRLVHLAAHASDGVFRTRFLVVAGAKAPTAPLQRDPIGRYLPATLQPGCGAIEPFGGFDLVVSHGAWSFDGGASIYLPIAVREGPHAGSSLRGRVTAQWQAFEELAFRGGIAARAETKGELAEGASDPDSGGFVGYATLEALARLDDLVVTAGAIVPVAQAFYGAHREGPIALATVAYDF